jgi:hypothetical protein
MRIATDPAAISQAGAKRLTGGIGCGIETCEMAKRVSGLRRPGRPLEFGLSPGR